MRLFSSLLQAGGNGDEASSQNRPNLRKLSGVSHSGRINPVMLAGCLATVAGICGFVYAVYPSNEYAAVQRENRRNYDAEKNQPGEMRVWSSPFGHKGK